LTSPEPASSRIRKYLIEKGGAKMKNLIISFSLLFSALSFAQDSLWTQKADIRYSREHASAIHVNGKIYLIGGLWDGNRVEEYTIETDTWQTKSSMPTPRAFMGSGLIDGKIYIMGGAVENTNLQSVVEMYDPAANEWTTANNLPEPWFGMGSCVYNDRIYIFGGKGGSGAGPGEKTVQAFDPVTGEWISDLADMPIARWEAECALIDNTIYVIGGFYRSNGGASDEVEAYHPESDSWTVKAPLPERRIGGAVAALDGKIYYFGGNSTGPPQQNIWEYDPDLDQWNVLPDMPFGWTVISSCVADDRIYLMAGSKVSYPFNDNFLGVYSYKPPTTATRIEQKLENTSPSEITLNQNYPNPFNPTTTISYALPEPGYVTLDIFNIHGEKVISLVDSHQEAGFYKVEWDGRNDFGSSVSNGIYLFRFYTGVYNRTLRMLLLK
jgi:N-acetylneuraminic acid mutarotase